MIFPKSTIIDKKIPKQKFYNNIDIKAQTKKQFTDFIDTITLANKLSKETINIPKTEEIEEILVFEIILKNEKNIDGIEEILTVIDKSIPYPILYKIPLSKKTIYKIAYKIRNKNDPNKNIVDVYLTREVKTGQEKKFEKEFQKTFNAINLKILYDNILKLFLNTKKANIKENINKYKEKLKLIKEEERLTKLVTKEKQPDKQYQIHKQLKTIEKKLKKIK